MRASERTWFVCAVIAVGALAWSAAGADVPVTKRSIPYSGDGLIWLDHGDLNGDGHPDLLSTTRVSGALRWHESDGGSPPAFSDHLIDQYGFDMRAAIVADLDGDNDMDIALCEAVASSRNIGWYENTLGDGSAWVRHQVTTSHDDFFSLAAGDLDGDGDLDLAWQSVNDNSVGWLENDGGQPPVFAERIVSTAVGYAWNVDIADVNGDGHLDLLAAAQTGDAFYWFENNGAPDPAFTQRLIANQDNATFIKGADINGDGLCDIIGMASGGPTRGARVYFNNGGSPPTFTPVLLHQDLDKSAIHADVADLNLDGDLDVLVCISGVAGGRFAWFENSGGPLPTFVERTIDAMDRSVTVSVADLDGDGDIDPVGGYGGTASAMAWYENLLPEEPTLFLRAQDECLNVSEGQLVVEVVMTASHMTVVGGQYLLSYDPALMDFVSAEPGDAPFTKEVYGLVDEVAGTIVYATGPDFGGVGTNDEVVVARLTFDAAAEWCEAPAVVAFRAAGPGEQPTRLVDDSASALEPATTDLGPTTHDDTPPVLAIPPDVATPSDAGVCVASLDPGFATATDNCTPIPDLLIEWVRSDGQGLLDPYAAGTTTIDWTATDLCGNATTLTQTIVVDPSNVVDVLVELQPNVESGPFDRCVRFELFPAGGGAAVVVEETITFTGGLGTVSLSVPCDLYDCVTAGDDLHTLRRTDDDDFGIVGTVYMADFTSTGSLDDDSLIGGNANGDTFIDIIDFAVFITRWGETPGADTPCGTVGPHPDFSGSGEIDMGDFSFIQINFFESDDPACGARSLGPVAMPRDSITVAELVSVGLGRLAWADLDRDGVVDGEDMSAFLGGARPLGRADLDGSLTVDLDDMLIFVSGYAGGDAALDVDGSGRVDVGDLRGLINAFGASAW